MTEWATIEYQATQRLVGALVGKYGATLSEETEEQAGILAFVALAGVRSDLESLHRLHKAGWQIAPSGDPYREDE